jgi:hypothetical protein
MHIHVLLETSQRQITTFTNRLADRASQPVKATGNVRCGKIRQAETIMKIVDVNRPKVYSVINACVKTREN